MLFDLFVGRRGSPKPAPALRPPTGRRRIAGMESGASDASEILTKPSILPSDESPARPWLCGSADRFTDLRLHHPVVIDAEPEGSGLAGCISALPTTPYLVPLNDLSHCGERFCEL